MKTTYNKKEVAQRERTKNIAIYSEAAQVARDAFERLDIAAGFYTPAQVATAINKYIAKWSDADDDYFSELVKIEVDTFSCSFPRGLVFDILNRWGSGLSIPSAVRVSFERTEAQNDDRRAAATSEAEAAAEAERQAQAEAERQAREAEEKRARRRENDRRRRAEKKAAERRAQAEAEREAAQAEAERQARRAAMSDAEKKAEADAWARRMESTARRAKLIVSQLQKFSAGREVAEVHKIYVVSVAAYGKTIFKAWAVGLTDSFYFLTGEIKPDGLLFNCDRSYKIEGRAAVANWLTMTRRAAIANGWELNFYSERPAAPADSYFLADIATATETTVKKAEAERQARRAALVPADTANDSEPAAVVPEVADIETPAEDTTANDDTAAAPAEVAAPAIERDPRTGRRAKSLDDIESQRERIRAAALDIVLTREGHSDGRTKEDRRLYSRLQLVNEIKNLYGRRIHFYFARLKMRYDRAALVPADVFAPLMPVMTATTENGVYYDFTPFMEPGAWEPSANTFSELIEALKYDDIKELAHDEIIKRASDAAHRFTAEAGLSNRYAVANELINIFMQNVESFAAASAPRFESSDAYLDSILDGYKKESPAEDVAAPAEVATANDSEPESRENVADVPTVAPAIASEPESPENIESPAAIVAEDTTANDDTAEDVAAPAEVVALVPEVAAIESPAEDLDTANDDTAADIETGTTAEDVAAIVAPSPWESFALMPEIPTSAATADTAEDTTAEDVANVFELVTTATAANVTTAAAAFAARARRWFTVAASLLTLLIVGAAVNHINHRAEDVAALVPAEVAAIVTTADDSEPENRENVADVPTTAPAIVSEPESPKTTTARASEPRARRHRRAAVPAEVAALVPDTLTAAAPADTARAIVAAEDTTAAPVALVPEVAEDLDTANDDTAADIETETTAEDVAAPAEVAEDDTADDSESQSDTAPTSTGTTAPPSPSSPAPAAVAVPAVPGVPAAVVLALLLTL